MKYLQGGKEGRACLALEKDLGSEYVLTELNIWMLNLHERIISTRLSKQCMLIKAHYILTTELRYTQQKFPAGIQ